MGTAEDEARARDDFERVKTENLLKAAEQARALEEYRKQQEAAKQQGQSKMVADTGPAANWPDGAVPAPPSTLDKVAGALRVGHAGDAAFAKQLLDAERRPVDGATAPGRLDGSKGRIAGALNARGATPAVER